MDQVSVVMVRCEKGNIRLFVGEHSPAAQCRVTYIPIGYPPEPFIVGVIKVSLLGFEDDIYIKTQRKNCQVFCRTVNEGEMEVGHLHERLPDYDNTYWV